MSKELDIEVWCVKEDSPDLIQECDWSEAMKEQWRCLWIE